MAVCFANLIKNGSKCSPDNTAITIAVTKYANSVAIKVTNHGVGVAEADYEKVFLKFARVTNELSNVVSARAWVFIGSSGMLSFIMAL